MLSVGAMVVVTVVADGAVKEVVVIMTASRVVVAVPPVPEVPVTVVVTIMSVMVVIVDIWFIVRVV